MYGLFFESLVISRFTRHQQLQHLNLYYEYGWKKIVVGFFNTGAYQEAISGFGGIKHCLIPSPKHVIINKDEDGNLVTKLFSKEQSAKSMLKILGY